MKPRTLADGEKITEPGIYAISLERHHSQPCNGFSVTSGVLRTMELGTPADVWAFHRLNPARFEKQDTDALRMGVAMALYVEGGPQKVLEGFQLHAEDKPRRPTTAQIAAYYEGRASDAAVASVEYWRAVDADPNAYLTKDEFAELCAMGAILERDPNASVVMRGMPEVTMAWRDESTGIWVLSRPDVISLEPSVIDYKRMATRGGYFSPTLVDRRIDDGGYLQQIALGAEGFERLYGEWPNLTGIVAQLASPPYHVITRAMDEEDLRIAQFQNRRALTRISECLLSGQWPGPGEVVGSYQMRKERRESLLAQMNTEGTAP